LDTRKIIAALVCVALSGPASAQPAPREVKVTVPFHVRDFSRCLAQALDHFRPELKHAAVSVGEGMFEVRSRQDANMLMVNHIRQKGREVTVTTRLSAASPNAESWYQAVDKGIADCKQESGEHKH
jgi:hypothetical protein